MFWNVAIARDETSLRKCSGGTAHLRTFRPVFLKVGGIAPLGAILNGKGAKKPKGAIGG